MKRFLLAIGFIIFSGALSNAYCQISEGKITYDISYPESGLDEETLAMLPTESNTVFKSDKMRIDMKMGMGMNNIILVDNAKKEVHLLMDMMGNKMDMLMTDKDIDKEIKDEGEYTITKKEGTRQIAGYPCNKALIKTKDGKEFSVWYTKEIKVKNANWNNQFKSIDGFLMEFRLNQNGLTMEMTAREVSIEKVNDDVFNIPPGYKVMSKEDLKRMTEGK